MFYLGTHKRHWVKTAGVPLFISVRTWREGVTLPRATVRHAMDSSGFTEIQKHGQWTVTPAQYVKEVRRVRDEVGLLDWAAPMDWMCEPAIIHGGWHGGQYFAGTHLSVAEHQRRTVDNFLHLRTLAPDLPIIPVLQGWEVSDYEDCADLYTRAGIDLAGEPVVGVGSVCRRQATAQAAAIITTLAGRGIALHGFGFKTHGLGVCGSSLTSADSLAWSAHARRRPPLPGHTHKNCANCQPYALQWRTRALNGLPSWNQPTLDITGGPK
ncbi:deazapurine DNA modification protein DpdA family protein [Streptomyces sp. H39-C1]|uniref:deazapurine DNA modification protein DpdA family protein n=1 Tax=Streptomyces sp. H39-C1 TaxID=3004355 RepID=UPI0022AF4B9E|nr:hypothetical protein [Streptomyces sp. H39-C1]MCZ4096002.1 hypothetical protein [Streptomyces sp. H39-C1]